MPSLTLSQPVRRGSVPATAAAANEAIATGGVVLIVLGGLAYTLGVVFYLSSRLPYHHAVWHGFVLAGSTLHFFAVLLFVIPRGASS